MLIKREYVWLGNECVCVCIWEDDIKMDLREVCCVPGDWIVLAEDREQVSDGGRRIGLCHFGWWLCWVREWCEFVRYSCSFHSSAFVSVNGQRVGMHELRISSAMLLLHLLYT